MGKLVFHVDVNSAFLSWEAARRVAKGEPDIRLIPAAIGGDREKRTGVVLAKSIPAKKFGIKTGEPIGMALRLLGIALTNITREDVAQFSLFADEGREKARKIDQATDALNAKFGSATIVRGSSIQSKLDAGKKYKAQMELQKTKEEK